MYSAVYEDTQMVSAVLANTNNGQEFNFENVPNIAQNNIEIYGIEAYSADQLKVDNAGRTVIPSASAAGITVTLVDNHNDERQQDMPLTQLITALQGGFTKLLKSYTLSLTKCKVKINENTGMVAGQVVAFNILYRYKPKAT